MILSIDIGGTAVKMGLVDEGGEVHARHEASVCFDGYRTPILTTVMREAEAFLRRENAQVAGIGVSATGQVDDRAGVVIGTTARFPAMRGRGSKKRWNRAFICRCGCSTTRTRRHWASALQARRAAGGMC